MGCGALRLIDTHTGELKRMYVAPEARGRGLGRRLVEALEQEARALGSSSAGPGDGQAAGGGPRALQGRRFRSHSSLR